MADLTLTDSEQREIFRNPEALMVLMTYHDIQQDQADSMGAECYGNKLRYEELKVHGKAIVEQDPEIWSDEVLRAFGITRSDGVAAGVASASGSAPGVPVVLRRHHPNCAYATLPDQPTNCSCPPIDGVIASDGSQPE